MRNLHLASRCKQNFLPPLFLLEVTPSWSIRIPQTQSNSKHLPSSRRCFTSKSATQSSQRSAASDSESDVNFQAIDGAESFYRYGHGGYHPVAIGDRLGGQYHVLNKLGHGSYSTVWLARDEKLQQLVAVKVCTADTSLRESEILSLLNTRSTVDDARDDITLGRDTIPRLLNTFLIHGPHGTHPCLVTDVARCSMSAVKDSCTPLRLPVARSIAAQLILAVAYLHCRGFVHGDLHLGNVLLKLPQDVQFWCDEELLAHCGEPILEPVKTFDDKPIPPHVPLVATLPIWFRTGHIEELSPSEAQIMLTDFGESYQPLKESKFECRTPAHSRPPESRFEPLQPKSFPSDIWTLACTVWATLAQGVSLFETFFSTEDSATRLQVQTLGRLPDEWWQKWPTRSQTFTEDGKLIQANSGPVYTFDYQFEDGIQDGRERHEMELMGEDEKKVLLAMLRPMLAYKPEQRCTIYEVLHSEWMTKYAMLDYKMSSCSS